MHLKITNRFPKFARKVQPIRAKPLANLLVDRSILSKFLLDTLEGTAAIGDGVVICRGDAGDVWQQIPSKLLKKYDVTDIDSEGWLICTPKPENSINIMEVTPDMAGNNGEFYILGNFGVQCDDGLRQYGEVGDYIGQNCDNPTDIWVIKRKIFQNTYVLLD